MTTHIAEKKIFIDFEKEIDPRNITPFVDNVKGVLQSYGYFNLLFAGLLSLEILYLLFHLTFLIQGFVLAIHLALIFATLFAYYTLRLHYHTKKVEKLVQLKTSFVELSQQEDQFLITATMCCKLADQIHGQELHIYPIPTWLNFISPYLEKIMAWFFWNDIHFMKEMLLRTAIEQHVKMVQLEPTNLEVHVGLANAYVMLSGLYVNHLNKKDKFREAAERAIEEFKILRDYAPNDPWVYSQLAFSYRDLQMPEEEIKSYESILELCPGDKETLFKLGRLYFEQGFNAKGLKIYETLKKSNYKKGETLIQYYGSKQLG